MRNRYDRLCLAVARKELNTLTKHPPSPTWRLWALLLSIMRPKFWTKDVEELPRANGESSQESRAEGSPQRGPNS